MKAFAGSAMQVVMEFEDAVFSVYGNETGEKALNSRDRDEHLRIVDG